MDSTVEGGAALLLGDALSRGGQAILVSLVVLVRRAPLRLRYHRRRCAGGRAVLSPGGLGCSTGRARLGNGGRCSKGQAGRERMGGGGRRWCRGGEAGVVVVVVV